MRVTVLLALQLAVITMSETATAKTATDCEAVYQAVTDAKAFPMPESKIRHLQDRGRDCKGTGIYESRLAYFYVAAGKTDEAVKVLNEGLSTANAYHKELEYSLADIEVSKGQLDSALARAAQLQQEYRDWYGGYMLAAKITLMQGKFAESIQHGTEANKRSETSSTYLGLAVAHHQLKQDEQAVEAGLMAIKLDPTVVRSGVGMNETIYSLVRLTRYKDAAELAKTRVANDGAWRQDATFAKAYEYLRTKAPDAFAGMPTK